MNKYKKRSILTKRTNLTGRRYTLGYPEYVRVYVDSDGKYFSKVLQSVRSEHYECSQCEGHYEEVEKQVFLNDAEVRIYLNQQSKIPGQKQEERKAKLVQLEKLKKELGV